MYDRLAPSSATSCICLVLLLINLVQGTLDNLTSYPLGTTSPALVGISFSTTLTFVSSANSSDQQNAIANAMSAAQSYINNLAMGQEFVINQLVVSRFRTPT